MGSWSVYCGISNITIHDGEDALLVPLEKASKNYNDFDQWKLATFPIFGCYNDYGDIGYIKKDFNTTLIENEYQCSIEEFCHCLVRSEIDEKDGQGNLTKEQAEKISPLSYMWIRKDVYEFMINHRPEGFGRCGSLDFGDKNILNILGIEYVGENKNDTRYNKLYKHGKKYFKSDGTWLHCCSKIGNNLKSNVPIYRLKDLKKILPDLDFSFLENKEEQHLLGLFDNFLLKIRYLSNLFNIKYSLTSEIRFLSLTKNISLEGAILSKDLEKECDISNLLKSYLVLLNNNDPEMLSILADLITLKKNCFDFSKQLTPYVSCITPQCGEDKIHLSILKGFVEILEKTIAEDEDED